MNPFTAKVFLTTLILVLITLTVTIIDIAKSKLNKNNKVFWILMVLSFNIFGTIAYFIMGRKQD
jgi:hypothetical protein